MGAYSKLRLELEISAQKIIQQQMINNTQIQADIVSGVEKAFDDLNVEVLVATLVQKHIQDAIRELFDQSGLKDKIRDHLSGMVDKEVDSIYEKLKPKI